MQLEQCVGRQRRDSTCIGSSALSGSSFMLLTDTLLKCKVSNVRQHGDFGANPALAHVRGGDPHRRCRARLLASALRIPMRGAKVWHTPPMVSPHEAFLAERRTVISGLDHHGLAIVAHELAETCDGYRTSEAAGRSDSNRRKGVRRHRLVIF